LPDGVAQCCVTSPPYWGLRDYGVAGQIGLEPTIVEFLASLVPVFREVRRVLRSDGVCWVNIGDSYVTRWGSVRNEGRAGFENNARGRTGAVPGGFKEKELFGMPWRLAFALQADGWWLRDDVIWAKPNPMPESVKDRPTRAHEYLFMLTKSQDYFYDLHAIAEPVVRGYAGSSFTRGKTGAAGLGRVSTAPREETATRNARSVWTIASKPYKGAHFAVFPPALPERCIRASTSERGACDRCGAPHKRLVSRQERPVAREDVRKNERDGGMTAEHGLERTGLSHFKYNEWLKAHPPKTLGWEPSCNCGADIAPCLVLDPFAGSGTTCSVARSLGRDYIGIELNPAYVELARHRLGETEAAE
jgi:DNA modification methylase